MPERGKKNKSGTPYVKYLKPEKIFMLKEKKRKDKKKTEKTERKTQTQKEHMLKAFS